MDFTGQGRTTDKGGVITHRHASVNMPGIRDPAEVSAGCAGKHPDCDLHLNVSRKRQHVAAIKGISVAAQVTFSPLSRCQNITNVSQVGVTSQSSFLCLK